MPGSKVHNSIVLEETDREAYECVVRLVDKVVEVTEGAGNESVSDMLLEQMYENIFEVGSVELYNMYRFMLRMVYRVKSHPEEREFNQVSFDDNVIRITNYDFKTYEWLHEKHYCEGLSNDIAEIKRGVMPPAVEKHFIKLAQREEENRNSVLL